MTSASDGSLVRSDPYVFTDLTSLEADYAEDKRVLHLIASFRNRRAREQLFRKEHETIAASIMAVLVLGDRKFERAIQAALKETIRCHGPITENYIPSAQKRIWGNLKGLLAQRFGATESPPPP